MVISRTKFEISHDDIRRIFSHAGFAPVTGIRSLGAGEFNAVYAVEADGETYALKVGADNSTVMIYEKDMMKSELFWYQVIAERTDLRVPRVFFSDFTKTIIPTNYFIMEFIPGPQKDQLEATEAQRAKGDAVIAGMIARLHQVRGEKYGYPQCGLHESWDIALEHMIQNLIRDAQKVNLALPRAEKVLELIDRYRSVLSGAPCRLISFDAWEPNFICVSDNPDQPEFAWIDPERCLWGDPMMDFLTMELGNWNLSRKTRTLSAYNAVAEFPVSGTREEEIRYAFGLCYLAGIVECEKHYRYSPGLPNWDRSIEFSDLLYEIGFSMLEQVP